MFVKYPLLLSLALLGIAVPAWCQETPVMTIHAHGEQDILHAGVYSDYSRVVVGGIKFLKEFDLRTGQLLHDYDIVSGSIYESQLVRDISISNDGDFMFTCLYDPPIQPSAPGYHGVLWNTKTWSIMYTFVAEDRWQFGITASAFTPDGEAYLTGDYLGNLMLRRTIDGEIIRKYDNMIGVADIEYLESGNLIYLNYSGRCDIIDSESGEIVHSFYGSHAALSNNRKYLTLLTGRFRYEHMTFWDVLSGESLRVLNIGEDEFSEEMAVSPTGVDYIAGQRVVNSTLKQRRLADSVSRQVLRVYPETRSGEGLNDPKPDRIVEYFPDGRRFFTANGGDIHIWDISDVVPAVEDAQLHGQ